MIIKYCGMVTDRLGLGSMEILMVDSVVDRKVYTQVYSNGITLYPNRSRIYSG